VLVIRRTLQEEMKRVYGFFDRQIAAESGACGYVVKKNVPSTVLCSNYSTYKGFSQRATSLVFGSCVCMNSIFHLKEKRRKKRKEKKKKVILHEIKYVIFLSRVRDVACRFACIFNLHAYIFALIAQSSNKSCGKIAGKSQTRRDILVDFSP